MNTLNTPHVAALIESLFTEAERVDANVAQELSQLPSPDRDPTNYRALYGHARERFLAVSRETAQLLYLLTRATRARAVVEFGTSFGLSTLHLAAALRDNGGGRLIGSELEPHKAARAREHLANAGLLEGVAIEIREGDALVTLAHDLPERIDVVLLDGAKVLYPRILRLLEPRLPDGALIVVDNMDMSPELTAMLQGNPRYVCAPFSQDVALVVRSS
jgi:predicted O-methyltransferase YrrM